MASTAKTSQATCELSIVVPLYNEEANVEELYRRLTATLESLALSYELLFVDDGSRDSTFSKLLSLRTADPRVGVLRFSRNFGHHLAITAGLQNAAGRYTVLMDGDLQDRPEDIPALYAKIKEGYQCVFGIRATRHDSPFKRLSSKLFAYLMNKLVKLDVPLNSCVFRIMDRQFVDAFNQLGERHRFVTGLMSWMGFKQVGIAVVHDKRFAGQTKYPLLKMLLLALNSVTSFSFRPLQIASLVGGLTALCSVLGIVILFYRRLVLGYGVTGWTSVMVTILFLGGVQLIALGVLGEYVGRSYDEQKARPLYIIDQFYRAEDGLTDRKENHAQRIHQSALGLAS
ncbi:MAG: glycosyltransferase family 2 protein [Bdellovibrionales bacterium]|nr:glycosyltransferase family 2 protein [Bdellovibrionales bacterium]